MAPPYSTPALRDVVERASVFNAAAAARLQPFAASYQSSVAIVRRLPENVEGSSTIEQVAGIYRWSPSGVFQQHRAGYRVQTVGVPLPGASLLANGWVLPPQVGERLSLLNPSRPLAELRPSDEVAQAAADGVLHPLSLERTGTYFFRGGDTVAIEMPDHVSQRLVRVEVWPRTDLGERAAVFRGAIYLDPGTGALWRIRGQILTVGGEPAGGIGGVVNAAVANALMLDVANTEVRGAGWYPSYQWIELQAQMPLSTELFTSIRIVTRLSAVITATGGDSIALGPLAPQAAGLTMAPADSLGSYRDWSSPPGTAIAEVHGAALADVGPVRARPTGPPTLAPRGTTMIDFLRYNRVEGLFLGAAGTLRLRDAAPGVTVKGGLGYATRQDVLRPQLTATWLTGDWFVTARGERALDLATKFPDPLDWGRGLRALFSVDNYDYIDRWNAAIGLGRYLSRHRAGLARVEVGWAQDYATTALVENGPFGQNFSPNPAVDRGSYLRTLIRVEVSPEISARFARPGIGFRARYERGDGDLRYDRYQLGVVARANIGRILLTLVGDGGVVTGPDMPTQQLFLLGGPGSLPGYEYDQFAGDRAWLARGLVSLPLPLLDNPIPLGNRFSLPPIAPALSFRLYAGQAEASSPAASAAIGRLGTRPNPDGGADIPLAAPSEGVRATTEIRLTLFGTLIGLGVARPLEAGAKWKFQLALAQAF